MNKKDLHVSSNAQHGEPSSRVVLAGQVSVVCIVCMSGQATAATAAGACVALAALAVLGLTSRGRLENGLRQMAKLSIIHPQYA